MGIENITSKIIADAKGEADVMAKEVQASAESIKSEAEKKAARIVDDAKAKGAVDKEKQLTSRRAVAVIDGRNIVLGYKQKIISQCFEEAEDRVAGLSDKEYMDFLCGCVKASGNTEGEIFLNKEDAPRGDELLKRLESEVSGNSFTVSAEAKNIRGGLMIRQGNTWFNGSIEAIVEEIRNDLTAEVASVLFVDQEKQDGNKK